ncbi:hypothetical protein PTKIN_Ptkin04bG0128300 [Pterospermum kingtungense]
MNFLLSWIQAKQLRSVFNHATGIDQEEIKWSRPREGYLKCNTDVAVFTGDIQVGFGMIVRDAAGNFIATRTSLSSVLVPVKKLEISCLIEVMHWVSSLGYSHVEFETDCKSAVESIKVHWTDVSKFGLLVDHYRSVLMYETNFLVGFARRQANLVTHSLARTSHLYVSPTTFNIFSSCIATLMLNNI